jgi:hypothetical protein
MHYHARAFDDSKKFCACRLSRLQQHMPGGGGLQVRRVLNIHTCIHTCTWICTQHKDIVKLVCSYEGVYHVGNMPKKRYIYVCLWVYTVVLFMGTHVCHNDVPGNYSKQLRMHDVALPMMYIHSCISRKHCFHPGDWFWQSIMDLICYECFLLNLCLCLYTNINVYTCICIYVHTDNMQERGKLHHGHAP